MSEADAAKAVLDRFYKAEDAYMSSGGKDFGAVAETLHPDCVIYQPASLPYGGEWRGHEGFERWLKAFGAQWSALSVQNSQIFNVGDDGTLFSLSHVYATARPTGEPADWPLLQYFRVQDGLIVELRPFHWDTAAMLPALGLALPT